LDLVKTSPARTISFHHVPEGDFLPSPCVREDSVLGDIIKELRQAELAIVLAFQETHYSDET
jgi:hypothetical protein